MATRHRAYLFDTPRFLKELVPVLKAAGSANDPVPLKEFLGARSILVPKKGGVQSLADAALTLYYDPGNDRGLALGWEAVLFNLQRLTSKVDHEYAVLGNKFQAGAYVLAPGGGSHGFVMADDVPTLCVALQKLRKDMVEGSLPPQDSISLPLSATELYKTYDDLVTLYEDARAAARGLMMTLKP